MKLLTVVGARPQFIKAATLSRRLRDTEFAEIREVIVHTGQHYDANMSRIFFDELEIPRPAYNLGVGPGTQAEQTGDMMKALEPVISAENPDAVVLYGDTNSTLAGALVAAKAARPIAHVEAGLRSFRRGMPEEVNRVTTDRLSRWLFCPTPLAVANLTKEGRDDAALVGDVMLDGFQFAQSRADGEILNRLGVQAGHYVLATVHRAENTDDPQRLAMLLAGLGEAAETMPVILPLHPRTHAAVARGALALPDGLRTVEPVSYFRMVALLSGAAIVATDSGGLQKEAAFARVPCVTLREETEWVETIEAGWNRLACGSAAEIAQAIHDAAARPDTSPPDYGDGDAAGKILHILKAGCA